MAPGGWALLALFFGLWVLLSGKLDGFHLAVGALVALFVVWKKGGLQPLQADGLPRLRYRRLAPYLLWLFGQMLLSAVQVARVVLQPRRHLEPHLIQFRSEQPSLVAGVILANSITLTPGTLTIELNDNRLVVHALTGQSARELLGGAMARRVARLFTDEPPPPIERIAEPKDSACN